MVAATAARLLHAVAIIGAPTLARQTWPRLVGAAGTYLCGLALVVAALLTL